MKASSLYIVLILVFTGVTYVQADPVEVGESLSKWNCQIQVAVREDIGHGLIVWSQVDKRNDNAGLIYAADIIRHPTGNYDISEPFLVSEQTRQNYRPRVLFLADANTYLIVWDTGPYDMKDLLFNHTSVPGVKRVGSIKARAYRQFAGFDNIAGLGGIVQVSKPAKELNLLPRFVRSMESEMGIRNNQEFGGSIGMFWFSGDEKREEVYGHYSHGLEFIELGINNEAAVPEVLIRENSRQEVKYSDSDRFAVADVLKTSSGYLVSGMHTSSTKKDNNIYFGFYEIKNNLARVGDFLEADRADVDAYYAGLKNPVTDLKGVVGVLKVSEGGAARQFAGVTHSVDNVFGFDGVAEDSKLQKFDDANKTNAHITGQQFQRGIPSWNVEPAAKAFSDLAIVFSEETNQIRDRRLLINGKPKGLSNRLFAFGDRDLTDFHVQRFGNEMLVCYALQKNNFRTILYFQASSSDQ